MRADDQPAPAGPPLPDDATFPPDAALPNGTALSDGAALPDDAGVPNSETSPELSAPASAPRARSDSAEAQEPLVEVPLVRPGLIVGDDGSARCAWAGSDAEYMRYHDEEWGTPLHTDQKVFEKISLEGFQAGLSWITILRRRPAFRRAFRDFDIDAVAAFDDADVERLVEDASIIRHRGKITAVINNARITQSLIAAEGSGALDHLLWSFAPTVKPPRPRSIADFVVTTPESVALSKSLRALGFRFVGPTTMYALMQSAGVVDDHIEGCFRATP